MRRTLAILALLALAPPARAAEPERVAIPRDGGALQAAFYRPAGPGPFPAVVAMHGCGGLDGPGPGLNARHAD